MASLIAIRREDINPWERRTPLIPNHARELRERHGVETLVQSSSIRVFGDEDYRLQGVRVEEDIGAAPVVFALKEIPPSLIEKDKVYAFFSHTAKGQPHNMPMLKRVMELGSTIIDYEMVADDEGRRLLSFGNYAGKAGMVDTLWALGRRLLEEGVKTPFADLEPAHRYGSLVEAREAVARVGWKVEHRGLPDGLAPLIVGFLGYGRTSGGAQEIFDLLPNEEVAPGDVGRIRDRVHSAHRLHKAVFKEEHMVKPRSSARTFDLQDYYKNPGDYKPVVEDALPYLTVLVNGIFWTPHFPRFVTKAFLAKLFAPGETPALRVIGDISCDINGAIEATVKPTDPEDPVYVYDPERDQAIPGFAGRGPVILAVYNLPAELPLEASTYFSGALKEFIPAIARADFRAPFPEIELPESIRRAIIVYRGELTPAYPNLGPLVL